MPTAEEFLENLNNALNRTADEMKPTMMDAALNAKGLIVRRIQRDGFLSKYSSGKIPVYFLKGFTGKNGVTYPKKSLGARGDAFLKRKEKEQLKENKENKTDFIARVSWAEFRKAQGLQVRFVDLTYSGKMFQNWRVPTAYKEGLKVGGKVGATDDETAKKLKWNKKRYPDFDKMHEDDKKIIIEGIVKPKLLELLNKNLKLK